LRNSNDKKEKEKSREIVRYASSLQRKKELERDHKQKKERKIPETRQISREKEGREERGKKF